MSRKYWCLILPSILILTGCLEEDSITVSPDFKLRENVYLREYYEGDQIAFSFQYNGSNQIIEQLVRTVEGNEISTFEYNEEGQITEIESLNNGRRDIQQLYYAPVAGEDKIDSIVYFFDGSLWAIRKMIYGDHGHINRIMEFNAGSPLIFNDYKWEGDNMTQLTRYFPREDTTGMVRWVYTYSYDSARNPYTLVYRDIDFHVINREPLSTNNWKKLVIRRYPEDVTLQTVEKKFTYVNPGYPVRKRTTITNYKNEIVGELVSDFIY